MILLFDKIIQYCLFVFSAPEDVEHVGNALALGGMGRWSLVIKSHKACIGICVNGKVPLSSYFGAVAQLYET
jgi:hypothetical protein